MGIAEGLPFARRADGRPSDGRDPLDLEALFRELKAGRRPGPADSTGNADRARAPVREERTGVGEVLHRGDRVRRYRIRAGRSRWAWYRLPATIITSVSIPGWARMRLLRLPALEDCAFLDRGPGQGGARSDDRPRERGRSVNRGRGIGRLLPRSLPERDTAHDGIGRITDTRPAGHPIGRTANAPVRSCAPGW